MTNRQKEGRALSSESRERMRASALARYDSDAEETHARIRAVLKAIQAEMAGNDGIYQQNKGAISMAEVARRGQIHPVTFHKPRYKQLGIEVKVWLETLKQDAIVGRTRVRKELGVRIQDWKELYDDLKEAHRVCGTDLDHAQTQLEEANAELAGLQERLTTSMRQIEELHQKLARQSRLKVLPIHLQQ